ncbi:MAG: hypothetical protein LBR68_03275 [Lachnoclostridium sp.]|jgi:hypothetical protein|nr:hypothetical protein [Lachnoclostridium sp.]
MNNYENQLDEIRLQLFEKTKGMEQNEIITLVNAHARKIAQEFGISMTKETKSSSPSMVGAS